MRTAFVIFALLAVAISGSAWIACSHVEETPAKTIPFDVDLQRERIDRAIDSAIAFFKVQDLEVVSILMLERLNEIYELETSGEMQSLYDQALSVAGEKQMKDMLVYQRIIERSHRVTQEQLDGLDRVDAMTMRSLYCDSFPLPHYTLDMWSRSLTRGGYEATHVPLAYRWALDNGCALAGDLEALEREMVSAMRAVVTGGEVDDRPLVPSDLRMEAMMMLGLINKEQHIDASWIEAVLDAQSEGGSWSVSGKPGPAHQHATAIALWLLLDLQSKNRHGPRYLKR